MIAYTGSSQMHTVVKARWLYREMICQFQ